MNTKNRSFLAGLLHALDGIKDALQKERNLKIHAAATALVIVFGFLLNISRFEWMICILLFGLVIGAELMNTALELTVDISMPQRDPRAKRVKDTAAGAVLVVSLAAAAAGLIIFVPKLLALL